MLRVITAALAIGLATTPGVAQDHQGHQMKHDGKAMPMKTPWAELNDFHGLLHAMRQPMMMTGDLGPARATAAPMAAAAATWAKSTPPTECKAPADIQGKVDLVAREAEAFAKLIEANAADEDVKTALDKLHRLFMPAHMGCMPDMPGMKMEPDHTPPPA